MSSAAKTKSTRKYPCALCGREDVATNMTYSRFTGNRFCFDRGGCAKRKAKTKKAFQ